MASEIKAVGQDKTPERLLAEAEKRIKMLEAKVAEQQKTIRDLRSQSQTLRSDRITTRLNRFPS
jgi:uncharacterized coiled-coil protein SlyX